MFKFCQKKYKNKQNKLISLGMILFLIIILVVLFILFSRILPKKDIDKNIEYFGQEPNIKDVTLSNPLAPLNKDNISNLELKDSFLDFKQQDLDDQSLALFLNDNFNFYKYDSLIALSPADFYQSRSGSEVDLAVFVADVLSSKVIAAGVLRFDYQDKNKNNKEHAVAIYRDKELPKYITLGLNNSVEIYHHGWSFTELIAAEEARLGVKISRYAYFPEGSLDLSEPQYPYEWQLVR